MNSVAQYKPRYFVFDKIWNVDGVAFKVYLIGVDAEEMINTDLLDGARRYVEDSFPSVHQEEGHAHGLGYVILHAGEMSNWLLVHWWAHNDIALRMLASAELGETTFNSQDHRHFHACVWEHVVVDFERNAWVQKMMSKTESVNDYLGERLADGYY